MKIQKQPDYLIFADSAKKGENAEFPDISRGWGITIEQTASKPPMEWMNGAFNRVDKNMLYLLQQGVPEWSELVKYPTNAIIKYNGVLYTSITENENEKPTNTTKWKKTQAEISNATIKNAGIVKLSSDINSRVENEAATPLAVKKVNDQIETKYSINGGEIKGNVTISGVVEVKNAQTGKSSTLKTNPDGSFILSHNDGTKTEQKLAFNSSDNTFYFTNLKNVAVNGRPILALGDGGINSVGAAFTNNNFDNVAVDGCGFYNLSEISNGTFPDNYSKLCSIINISRSFSDNKKCSQIIVDTINNRMAFRTASNSDFKPWVELLTSENINNYQNGIGVNQKWQNVTDSRIIETVYTNTTSKPIFINIVVDVTNSNYKRCSLLVDNVVASQMVTSSYGNIGNARSIALSAIIPPGSTYMLTADSFNPKIYNWSELR